MEDYPPADGRRERLLAHFGVPQFVANQTCFELNGYWGAKPEFDDEGETKQLTSYCELLDPSTGGLGTFSKG